MLGYTQIVVNAKDGAGNNTPIVYTFGYRAMHELETLKEQLAELNVTFDLIHQQDVLTVEQIVQSVKNYQAKFQ